MHGRGIVSTRCAIFFFIVIRGRRAQPREASTLNSVEKKKAPPNRILRGHTERQRLSLVFNHKPWPSAARRPSFGRIPEIKLVLLVKPPPFTCFQRPSICYCLCNFSFLGLSILGKLGVRRVGNMGLRRDRINVGVRRVGNTGLRRDRINVCVRRVGNTGLRRDRINVGLRRVGNTGLRRHRINAGVRRVGNMGLRRDRINVCVRRVGNTGLRRHRINVGVRRVGNMGL